MRTNQEDRDNLQGLFQALNYVRSSILKQNSDFNYPKYDIKGEMDFGLRLLKSWIITLEEKDDKAFRKYYCEFKRR